MGGSPEEGREYRGERSVIVDHRNPFESKTAGALLWPFPFSNAKRYIEIFLAVQAGDS